MVRGTTKEYLLLRVRREQTVTRSLEFSSSSTLRFMVLGDNVEPKRRVERGRG
jgi:hypothetical protein